MNRHPRIMRRDSENKQGKRVNRGDFAKQHEPSITNGTHTQKFKKSQGPILTRILNA
jgi:hypothetical protein